MFQSSLLKLVLPASLLGFAALTCSASMVAPELPDKKMELPPGIQFHHPKRFTDRRPGLSSSTTDPTATDSDALPPLSASGSDDNPEPSDANPEPVDFVLNHPGHAWGSGASNPADPSFRTDFASGAGPLSLADIPEPANVWLVALAGLALGGVLGSIRRRA